MTDLALGPSVAEPVEPRWLVKPVLVDQLPAVMAGDPFLRQFLSIFQELTQGLQEHAAAVPLLVDPTVAPLAMVRHVASWFGAELAPELAPDHQRRVAAGMGPLLRRLGTAGALARLLHLFTGGSVHVYDDGGVFPIGAGPPATRRITVEIETPGPFQPHRLLRVLGRALPVDVRAHVVLAEVTYVLRPGTDGDVVVSELPDPPGPPRGRLAASAPPDPDAPRAPEAEEMWP